MSAEISDNGVYRWRLDRKFPKQPGQDDKRLAFCMLNPSTADAEVDDPTIRRCLGFARRERAAGITVVNVYAYRSTDPKALWNVKDPIGFLPNPTYIFEVAKEAGRMVCAWGVNARPIDVRNTLDILRRADAQVLCLGTTKDGHPRHPLYVRGDQPLIPWSPR